MLDLRIKSEYYTLRKVDQDLNTRKEKSMIKGIIIALGIAYGFYKVRLERAKVINQELQNKKLKQELEQNKN